jgi:hypothetical protein
MQRRNQAVKMLVKSSIVAFALVVSGSAWAQANTARTTDEGSTHIPLISSDDGSFDVATTLSTNRKDRRNTRQDCRHQNGVVGHDKRNCKQEKRKTKTKTTQPTG